MSDLGHILFFLVATLFMFGMREQYAHWKSQTFVYKCILFNIAILYVGLFVGIIWTIGQMFDA